MTDIITAGELIGVLINTPGLAWVALVGFLVYKICSIFDKQSEILNKISEKYIEHDTRTINACAKIEDMQKTLIEIKGAVCKS